MTTEEVAAWSGSLDLPAFRARLGGPAFLLGRIEPRKPDPNADPDPKSDEESTAISRRVYVNAQVTIDLDGQVLPVVRAAQNPYSDKMAVGRTRNCDVRIDHPSISRLHALLQRGADGNWTVMDAGSSNGTRKNGDPLPRGRGVPLAFGDVLSFGHIAAQFVSPEMLYQALRTLRRPLG